MQYHCCIRNFKAFKAKDQLLSGSIAHQAIKNMDRNSTNWEVCPVFKGAKCSDLDEEGH